VRERLTKLPSPAMAVAFVALLAALTGTAVALPGSNNVTSGDIRSGAVTSSDIRNNSIRGGDVRQNTLTGGDVSEGSLGTVPRASSAGFAGFAGSAGTASRANSSGSADALGQVRVVTSLDVANPNSDTSLGTVRCPSGTVPIGGGSWASGFLGHNVNTSFPSDDTGGTNDADELPDGWEVWMNNTTGSAQTFNVYAICTRAAVFTSEPLFSSAAPKK
jgi:hypothetical protein